MFLAALANSKDFCAAALAAALLPAFALALATK
jgi:hypothetical protein